MKDHIEATFFEAPAEFGRWLTANHATEAELWVGFHRRATGRPSLTWAESVDEALCVGWIDGIRKGIDAERYAIRFTPRRRTSTWSAVNVRRVPELAALGRMTDAGLRAFEARDAVDPGYSYEQVDVAFAPEFEARLSADTAASAFFAAQPARYRRQAAHWVMSAKRDDTRTRRFEMLVDDARHGRWIKPLAYGKGAGRR